jgi:ribosomal protein S18 acetylase RimI-like enzyme
MPCVLRWTENWGRWGDVGVVAWCGGKRVGSAWCRVQDEVLVRDEVGNPLPGIAIAVLPEERSRGVGGHLLAALERDAERRGLPAVSLTVDAFNPAYRLYERLGFVVVRREGDYLTMVGRANPSGSREVEEWR